MEGFILTRVKTYLIGYGHFRDNAMGLSGMSQMLGISGPDRIECLEYQKCLKFCVFQES